jgi:predicted HicB family RNase H-like nuclease
MKLMIVDGLNARIDHDVESDMFRGEILGLGGDADFCGVNPKELRQEFKKSLDLFLEVCR